MSVVHTSRLRIEKHEGPHQPAALPNYLKAGFTVYKEEVEDQG